MTQDISGMNELTKIRYLLDTCTAKGPEASPEATPKEKNWKMDQCGI